MKITASKKTFGLGLISLMVMALLLTAGCGTKEQAEGKSSDGSELKGTLTIAGSTSVQPFSELLAEKFMEKNPGVKINVQGGGSSQGVSAAISGVADIGSLSRDLKDEEKVGNSLIVYPIAIDGLSIVVNPANPVRELNTETVRNIYLGNIKNWKEVGGTDAPITLVSREEGSGTREIFSKMIMEEKEINKSAIIQNSTGAVRTTVAGDKNAIAYISTARVNSEVKALPMDGIQPTEANIKAGTYKLQRSFIYVTKGQPANLAKAYIDFVLGPVGQDIIAQEGAFKVSK